MADDEPLDDARAVAMAAAAAAARVVETLARESQQAAAQHRATLERAQDQHRAQHVLASLRERQPDTRTVSQKQQPLQQAQAWAKEHAPEVLRAYQLDHGNADTSDGRDSAQHDLINSWTKATGGENPAASGYDSLEQRQGRDTKRQAAGVPVEARQARDTADLMNGTDPALAAAEGTATKAHPARAVAAPKKERGR